MDNSLKSPAELQQMLGEEIKALRIGRGWTQRDLAGKAGLSVKAVATLERGEGSSVESLVRVLHAAGATGWIENLAPRPHISPIALLRSPEPPQRVRRRGEERLAS